MTRLKGKDQVSGTWGQFWWNNLLIVEVKQFEAKITANREDVQIGLSMDTKLMSLQGEGTFVLKKVYTRYKKEILTAWKKGEDPRFSFKAKIQDPDTRGKQSESITIDNVWFNELMLLQFEKGTLSEEEFSFGFTPEDADFDDMIAA